MSAEEFSAYLPRLAQERVALCRRRDLTPGEVLETAKTPLDIEEIGCTYAALGRFDSAAEVARREGLEPSRRDGILWTREVENLRRGDLETPDLEILGLREGTADPWRAGYVALCALGRLPYLGYPYPDW